MTEATERMNALQRRHDILMETRHPTSTQNRSSNHKPPIKPHVKEPPESEEQIKLVTWLRKRDILVAHFANGGRRNKFEAYRFKLLGVSAGVLDLIIPIARKGYHGLFIEMKKISGGTVSQVQKWWITELTREGYLALVANGFEEGKKIVIDYLGLVE